MSGVNQQRPDAPLRVEFRRGCEAILPLTPGLVVLGLLFGMMAREAGLDACQALAMSALVHAGSAQFTALGMWNAGAGLAIILTTLVINLRHLLMGASIAPHLRGLSLRWKALLALWMSDESYAVAMSAFERGEGSRGYFLGANAGIFVTWCVSGLLGAVFGAAIPDPGRLGLDLVFPFAFLGLLMSFLKGSTGIVVALAAGVLALLSSAVLPGKWYVIVAGVLASVLGVVLEEVTHTCRST